MNVTPRFLGRGSWLARRDPRVLFVVAVLFIFTVAQAWDLRLVVVLLALALAWYRLAAIPFREVRRNWVTALTIVTIVVLMNSILTGNRVEGMTGLHVYFHVPLLGTPVSAESLSYAASQWLRYVAMVAIGFPIAFCVAPSDVGAALAGLRLNEKIAFMVDLTFRFIPSLATDFAETIDAQRVRGYDPMAGRGGPIARLRRLMPVLTPLTIGAIVGAEDTIDAMDLRGFGTGRRTWLRELRFDRTDRLVMAGFATLLVVVTIAGFMGLTRLWVPPPLLGLGR